MKSIRVLHIADYFAHYRGNFIASLVDLSRKIKVKDGDMALALPELARKRAWVNELDIPVFFLNSSSPLKRLREILKISRNYDIIHTHFGTFDVYASTVKMLLGKKVIWHMHTERCIAKECGKTSYRLKTFLKYHFFSFDRIITVGRKLKHFLPKSVHRKVVYVKNGVDFSRLKILDKCLAKEKLGIPCNVKVFLTFGWNPYVKGTDVFLKALKKICRNGIVGIVITTKDIYPMSECAVKLPPTERVWEYYSAADFFVLPSRSEAASYSIAEAMYMGLLIIASALENVLDYYEEASQYGGIAFFAPENEEELSKLMKSFLNLKEEEYRRASEKNRKFSKNFDVDKWSTRIVEIYNELLV